MYHRKTEQDTNDYFNSLDRGRQKASSANQETRQVSGFEHFASPDEASSRLNSRQRAQMDNSHSMEVCEILARQRFMTIKVTKANRFSLYLADPSRQIPGRKQKREYLGTFQSIHEVYEVVSS